MVNGWRTGPEGIDAFLTRAGFGDALTTGASQSDVASADGIRDLLNQGRAATDGDDLITGISLAIQAAHLAARHDLPQPAADAVLLLARILVGTGNTEAAGDALAFAARLTTVLMADGQAADVPLVIAQLALVAIYFPLSGQPGQQIQAELTPICPSPAGASTRSASRAVNSVPSASMASHWSGRPGAQAGQQCSRSSGGSRCGT